jgi:hypothetical protein
VPTNAQLTLTLLRLGEANHAPLPPPPRTTSPPPDQPAPLTGAEAPLNATPAELTHAIHPTNSPHSPPHPIHDDADIPPSAKPTPDHHHHSRKGSKILNFFKGTTRGAVKTAIGTDTVRAKAGSAPAKNRLGVIPGSSGGKKTAGGGVPAGESASGPVEFEGRYDGQRGRVYLDRSGATVGVLAFVKGLGGGRLEPVWSVAVEDVVEMKKIGGYGWKAKLVVGWSMEREVQDGLVVRTGSGEEYRITAVPLRDELFNRVVAMGGQKWEAW